MNTNKPNFKQIPKGIKFAKSNSYDEEDIILEKIIATLIYNGHSIDQRFTNHFLILKMKQTLNSLEL
jgi:hypothetical protein